ncbi:MAG TPA: tRNA preQ1(34) S-adenosylmethionine ribosyltransferase-isomerase QueA [Candidatus Omnitrophota bacterium]|nr:tRNA preQ1(34) S-adenosylmethionine ribosyltransferase-isomerase QueA [Candidatus Omnitrophota bacterium]HPS20208.1 tRNA preQ1(34) S-adenosylmethionine ribosyltransferase-isomerase QueA [Candidatus Omnitrophota bacterium]
MDVKDFYYELPKELIAQTPFKERDMARLLVVGRDAGVMEEKIFRDIVDYFREGDCLVMNDTKVVPARLFAKRKTGGKVEVFLLDIGTEHPRALINPSGRIKSGEELTFDNGCKVRVMERANVGRFVEFDSPLERILETGHVPLPPYISRNDEPRDKEDYQTVYCAREGATASPTAGLHFTTGLLDRIKGKGVSTVFVTLHTGYGTFSPVKVDRVEDHNMHSEPFEINEDVAEKINRTKRSGGRVFAVGTTSCRVLESTALDGNTVKAQKGETKLFIYPPYRFKIVDALITNFHLPCSTLLMLVSAFAGKENIAKAYQYAVDKKFRFFSYGDAMLLI